jgi:hypothetical protein
MADDTTGTTAIKGMLELSTTIVMGLQSDINKIVVRQGHLEDLIMECNDLAKLLTGKMTELSHEIHEMRKLLHDPTVDALTGPLLEMQEKNKQRRERTNSRIYSNTD